MLPLITATAVLASGCGENSESAVQDRGSGAIETAPVIVERVELETELTRLEAVGTSRARRSVTIFPEASGEVVEVHFEAGEHVAADRVLVELDARDEELAVELAQVRLADARRLYQRYQQMGAAAALAETTLDEARTAADAARIELQMAQIELDDRSIEAPFEGFVGITEVDPGDRIGPDTAITTLDDRSVLLVSFDVPEILIDRLAVGDPISVTPWNNRNTQLQGRVGDIGSRIDPESRTFLARAYVENDDDRLRPGMSFRVVLELRGERYPKVPEVSVQWGGEGSFVWAVRDGKAASVLVDIVQRQAGQVLVDAALEAGEQVVVEGVQRMREGLEVSVRGDQTSTGGGRPSGPEPGSDSTS